VILSSFPDQILKLRTRVHWTTVRPLGVCNGVSMTGEIALYAKWDVCREGKTALLTVV
jgi:hypothetical protein